MSRRSPIHPASARFAARAGIGVALVGTLLVAVPAVAAVAARPAPVTATGTENPAPTDQPVTTPQPTTTASPEANPTPTPSAPVSPTPMAPTPVSPTPTATPTPSLTATAAPTAPAPPTAAPTPTATQPATGPINATSLTGRVTDQVTGAPLSGVTVYIYTEAGRYGTAIPITTTDADGGYTFYSLDVRNYTLQFTSSTHRSEWFGGAAEQADADIFPIALGEAVTGKNASLLPLDSISGTVTGTAASAEALAGATVTAFDTHGTALGEAVTSEDGAYTLTGLTPGSYTLRFTPPAGSAFVAEWWHDKAHPRTAAPVKLAADTAVTGKNAALDAGASVTGRISDSSSGAGIPNAWVYAYATDGSSGLAGGSIAAASTNGNGDYTLSGLVAGTYTLQFSGGSANGSAGYLREWLGNKPGRTTAVTFSLSAGETRANTDAAIVPTAAITGSVYAAGARNVGLNAATVSAIAPTGQVAAEATTNGSGEYTLTGLKPDNYTLRFDAPAGTDFDTTWWNDKAAKPTEKNADVIRVTAGEVVSGKTGELRTSIPE
jgi:protocatechuate 3,4-dioxygenase beta subunit